MHADISQFESLQSAHGHSVPSTSSMAMFNERIRRPGGTIHSGQAIADIYDWLHEFGEWKPDTPEEATDAVEKIDQSIRTVKQTSDIMLYTLEKLRTKYDKIAADGGAD